MFKKFRYLVITITLLMLVVLAAGCSSQQPDKSTETPQGNSEKAQVLRVGLVPNQSPDKVKTQYEPFRVYLAEKLGMEVELFVPVDYSAVVEAMANDKLDVAYFGGVTYVQAAKRASIYPIVTEIDRETKTTKYHSVIIVPADSKVQKIEELKGKTFAFGDVNSTSGSLYPKIMLDKAGIKVPQDLKEVTYTGAHNATAAAVQNGTVDAGGLEERILKRLIKKGDVDEKKIRVITKSDPIEGYPWAVRASLDKGLVDTVTQAFLDIKDPQLLDLLRAERYEKITDKDYDIVRQEATRLGLLK
ncbi:MAG: phosphate/phosphite/phosphonate ABC transporter substrate-binding protein [Clostridia bacterium]|nr:phosphate/phosphite/phosphonate ABC transporter substrate-binding protein [Clostridia bacterium]